MIYLLWPTARPQMFLEAHKAWVQKADNPSEIFTKVCVDDESDINSLRPFEVIINATKRKGVTSAAYTLTKDLEVNDSDIIILASDDFVPPESYDTWIKKQLSHYNGTLIVRDGHQTGGCITIPIMNGKCFKTLNRIIYHPSYYHLYSDAELYNNLDQLQMLKDLRSEEYPLFEHKHWANGKRQVDEIDVYCTGNMHHDYKNYETRMQMSLNDRLKVDVFE